jgi:oligosaccharide repeat unit polymerase
MLAGFQFQISYVSYPYFSLAVLIFAASLISFLLGHHFVRLICRLTARSQHASGNTIDIKKLRRFTLCLLCAASALTLFNIVTSGLPPVFGFFGFDTQSYTEYGRLKQLIFPLLMVIFVNSFLETSKVRASLYSSFAFLAMLCYVARGAMMLMLFQALIVFSIRTSRSKTKLYVIAILGLIGAAFLVDLIGSNRTGDVIFFAYMQIKLKFQQWPTVYLWIISYVSTPLSNLCWLVDLAHFDHVTWSFAYPVLPSFWATINPHENLIETSKIIDGVHTYLASYFLDFSYFGIFLINLFIGMISGYYSSARRISRHFLTCSIFLTCIAFIFFWDFFVYLETIVEFGLQAAAQYYFIRKILPEAVGIRTELEAIKS